MMAPIIVHADLMRAQVATARARARAQVLSTNVMAKLLDPRARSVLVAAVALREAGLHQSALEARDWRWYEALRRTFVRRGIFEFEALDG